MLQPWATLAVRGFKQWETRSRNIGIPLGELFIHASAGVDSKGHGIYLRFGDQFPEQAKTLPAWKEMTRGAIIGFVYVRSTMSSDWLKPEPLSEMEKLLGNYDTATHFAKFDRPYELERPVAAKGKLGIWQWNGPQ